MEKKNTVLLTVIAVATLLVAVVGATFAYFTATSTTGTGTGTTATDTAISLGNTNLDMGTVAATDAADMKYPGGMMVAGAKVTATVSDTDEAYNMTYQVNAEIDTTELGASTSKIKYKVYRLNSEVAASEKLVDGCTLQVGGTTTKTYHYTGCDVNALIKAGELVVNETEITTHTEKTTITIADEALNNVNKDAAKNYFYYLVVEYPNDPDNAQDTDQGKTITAKFTGISNGQFAKVTTP